MMYYRARYYDPQIGRFLQMDPEPGRLAMPSTMLTKYTFVANNPNLHADPSGKFLVVALIALGASWLTSGSFLGAITAVGATFLGSVATSGIYSAITGKWGDFWKNAELIFNVSAAFLGLSAVAGHFWGGGIKEIGANSWYQGFVGSETNVLGYRMGDLTIGHSSYIGGAYGSDLLVHSLGHTLQFVALAGILGPQTGGFVYLGFGGMGITSYGQWWENVADGLGGAL